MQTWVVYAILSMIFAGVTAILAKYGLQNISAETGLGIRTLVIFAIIAAINVIGEKDREIVNITWSQLSLLILSGITTTLSWLFYYRALKDGLVSHVVIIDKGSVVITLVLSFILFSEPVNSRVIVGALLVTAGIVVLVWK